MVWIDAIDSVRNMDELKSSGSTLGRKILGFEVVDSKIASALKKLLTADFKRRVYMEEQMAHQDNRFSKGIQIAYVTYDYFKIGGTGEALLDFNDPFRAQLKNDNVQGFDTKWCEVLVSMPTFPMMMYWVMYKKQLHHFEELQPLMALYLQDTVQKGESASYARLKHMVRRHGEHKIRDNIFSMPAIKKRLFKGSSMERKPKRKSKYQKHGDRPQWTSKDQCSREASCSFKHDVNK